MKLQKNKFKGNFVVLIIISLLFFNTSCHNHEHDNEQTNSDIGEGGHEHTEDEIPRFSYNIFGNNFELFFESSALINGKTSKIIAHYNTITDFKPISKGKLTISLTNKDSDIKVITEQPTRSGIFIVDLKPEKEGKFKLSFLYELDTLKELIEIDDIKVFADIEKAVHGIEETENHDEISYLKEQMWKIDFETKEVFAKDFSQSIKTVGEILPAQGEKRIVSSKTNGVVLFSARNLVVGKPINSGKELFVISGDMIGNENINVTYGKLKNEYEQCKIEYERHKKLAIEKIVSSEKLFEKQKEFISDSISYYNFLASFSKRGVSISSQISGYIQTMFVDEGQYVTTGQSLAVVSANSRMMIRADVPLKYYNLVNNITDAIFEIPFINKTISLKKLKGKVISVSSSVQSNGKYLPVYFEVQNDGSLIEGAFIECYLKIGIISNQLVIPKSALIEELGTFYVYIQTNGESFEKREVKIGSTDGINVQILSGLYAKERVVTKGTMQIKLASLSNGMDSHAGHSH